MVWVKKTIVERTIPRIIPLDKCIFTAIATTGNMQAKSILTQLATIPMLSFATYNIKPINTKINNQVKEEGDHKETQ